MSTELMRVEAHKTESVVAMLDTVGMMKLSKDGFTIDSVDAAAFIGFCQECGMPIVPGQLHRRYLEGEIEHAVCPGRAARHPAEAGTPEPTAEKKKEE